MDAIKQTYWRACAEVVEYPREHNWRSAQLSSRAPISILETYVENLTGNTKNLIPQIQCASYAAWDTRPAHKTVKQEFW